MGDELIQILMAFLGTIGVAIFFNIRKTKLLLVGTGGAVIWTVFLVVKYATGQEMIALFAASVLASVFAEILARIVKSPATVLLVPMVIALIPGGNLYYTMFYVVQGHSILFQAYLKLVLQEAASIALGIMIVMSAMQVIQKSQIYHQKKSV